MGELRTTKSVSYTPSSGTEDGVHLLLICLIEPIAHHHPVNPQSTRM